MRRYAGEIGARDSWKICKESASCCVSGGIAAYKMPNVASALRKAGAEVHVVMTQNATQFITPLTFESLTNHRCVVDTFARDFQYDIAHVSLATAADLILVAPATADVIAKLAHGIADDMLTTVVLAARCKKLVAPAMNTAMLENPITQDNLAALEKYGFSIIPPDSGLLACQAVGSGKMPEPEVLLDHFARELAREKTLAGVRVTVTAGPTQEALDPVRYLTNHSSGRMGYAIAREAMLRGAQVTLVSGPVDLPLVPFVETRPVTTAADMFRAVRDLLPATDVIKAAAVADYRPAQVASDKMKKSDQDLSIPLERTDDILGWVAEHRHPGLFVCGFSMETRDMVANSRAKLERKKLDMIVANNLKVAGAGFGTKTNVVTLITREGERELPLMGKDQVAAHLLDDSAAPVNASAEGPRKCIHFLGPYFSRNNRLPAFALSLQLSPDRFSRTPPLRRRRRDKGKCWRKAPIFPPMHRPTAFFLRWV